MFKKWIFVRTRLLRYFKCWKFWIVFRMQPRFGATLKNGVTRCLQGSGSVADPLKVSVGEDKIYDGFVLLKVL